MRVGGFSPKPIVVKLQCSGEQYNYWKLQKLGQLNSLVG